MLTRILAYIAIILTFPALLYAQPSPQSIMRPNYLQVDDTGLIYKSRKVSINRASPNVELDVSGNIRITGNVQTKVFDNIIPFYVRGSGLNNNVNQKLVLGGYTVYDGVSRGLRLTIVNKATHQVVSTTPYDVWGSTVASDSLATALNNMTSDQIGILASWDAWEGSKTVNLNNAMIRVGLYKGASVLTTTVTSAGNARKPYAAIFEPANSATGQTAKATEVLIDSYADMPYAELRGFLMDGSYVVAGSRPKALTSPDGSNVGVVLGGNENVGIGVTNPSHKLDINGNMRIYKQNNQSRIDFQGLSTDPAYIRHSEPISDLATLWLAPSDDWDVSSAQDDIVFGDSNLVHIRFRFAGNGQAFSTISFSVGAADYAEWMEFETPSQPGDLVGLNPDTGKVRKYQTGDEWIGIHSTKPGYVGNHTREDMSDMEVDHTLVAFLGQLEFDPAQVDITNRVVRAKDGTYIGTLLSNGKVFIGK